MANIIIVAIVRGRPVHPPGRFTCPAQAGMIHIMKSLAALLLLSLAPAAHANGLADRIWSAQGERFIDLGELESAIQDADIVLLGEIHDRASHHVRQARMIRWAAAHHQPGIVLEMIGPEEADALAGWQAGDTPDPDALGPAVAWEERGWPDWSIYQPIAEAALDHDLRLHAGAPDPSLFRQVIHEGLGVLDEDVREYLGLKGDLPEPARTRLLERLERVHCGLDHHLPAERMLAAQRFRDAAMSRKLIEVQARTGKALLIAGNGHVRRDYGVPQYLQLLAHDLKVVSIGLVPADGLDTTDVGTTAHRAFDFAWFTDGEPALADCDEHA